MWKRLSRQKDQTISSPTGVVHTTLPSGYLESIPEVNTPRNSVINPGLPPLPFRAVPPLEETEQSGPDRSSSIYSRQSLEQPGPPVDSRAVSSVYSDISPPDSPTFGIPESHSPHDVSPIESRPLSLPKARKQPPSNFKSNLPLPSKAIPTLDGPITKFGNSPGWRRDPSAGGLTRWDEYSGEPTTSEKGRQPSVKPGTAESFTAKREKNKQLGFRDRDPARRRATSKEFDDTSIPPREREPWKGASGRVTLVNTVRDDPSRKLPPIQIPRNNRQQSPIEIQVNPPRSRPSPISTLRAIPSDSNDDVIKPTVPLKAGTNSPRIASPVSSPIGMQHTTSPLAITPTGPSLQSPILAPKANRPSPMQDAPWNSPALQESHSPSHLQDLDHLRNLSVEDEPGSRFSATTVATTTENGSPRPSYDAPPVPTLPASAERRQRPLPSPNLRPAAWEKSSPKLLNRKPTPSQRASSLDSVTSLMTKSLPQCPPETQAVDKITGMEARLDDLARRRRNIEKILKGLTHVINPSSPGYDFKTKYEVKQTIASLNLELADIGQEEHDVGLRLHRAQKRRDKESCYGQPTGLWIKRVTS